MRAFFSCVFPSFALFLTRREIRVGIFVFFRSAMEESDKTTALKKAYAEIILNTAKEAAARVMFSERKAARFQHDLCSTKDEALRLLVRLKQMIDAKTIEAEITSSNQQRKIDELEAQLQEAEDIITDLRSELDWVRDKLKKARTSQLQSLQVTKTVKETVETFNEDVADTCIDATRDCLLNQTTLHDVCGSDSNVVVHDVENRSITEKADEELLSLEKGKENGTGESSNVRCIVLGLRARSDEAMKKPPDALKTSKAWKLRRRRRKRRWGKPKESSRRSCQSMAPLPSKASMVDDGENSCKTHLHGESEKSEVLKACKGLEEHLQRKRIEFVDEIAIIRKGKRSKNMKSLDQVMEACKESKLVTANVNDEEDASKTPNEVEAKVKPLPCLDTGLTLNKSSVDSVKAINQSKPSGNKDVLVKCENALVPSTKKGSETETGHSESSDLKGIAVSDEMNESSMKVEKNRFLKYTFQRKRKKGSLSDHDDSAYPAKKTVAEKENDAPEPNESSRGTRRVVQVARQLISMVGNKW